MTSRLTAKLVATLFFIGASRCLAASHGDRFAEACRRVTRALRAEDWSAFREECADEIVMERIQRVYIQFLSPKQIQDIFGQPDWINGDYLNGHEARPEDANDRDVLVTHSVLMDQKPAEDERRAFHEFCGFVRDSYARGVPAVVWGRNVRGWEVKSLFGPAVEGKVASNFKWRVQLEQIGGHWKVRKLITEAH